MALTHLREELGTRTIVVYEYDKRFATYGDEFVFWDYKVELSRDEIKADFLVVDPPFLTRECWEKVRGAVFRVSGKYDGFQKKTEDDTVKDSSAGGQPELCKLLVCTAKVMTDDIRSLLGCLLTDFEPRHEIRLCNKFGCFVNYNGFGIIDCRVDE